MLMGTLFSNPRTSYWQLHNACASKAHDLQWQHAIGRCDVMQPIDAVISKDWSTAHFICPDFKGKLSPLI